MPLRLPRGKAACMYTVDLLLKAKIEDGNTDLGDFSLEMAFKYVGLANSRTEL